MCWHIIYISSFLYIPLYKVCVSLFLVSVSFCCFLLQQPTLPSSLKFHAIFTHSEVGPWLNDQAKINTSLVFSVFSFSGHSQHIYIPQVHNRWTKFNPTHPWLASLQKQKHFCHLGTSFWSSIYTIVIRRSIKLTACTNLSVHKGKLTLFHWSLTHLVWCLCLHVNVILVPVK